MGWISSSAKRVVLVGLLLGGTARGGDCDDATIRKVLQGFENRSSISRIGEIALCGQVAVDCIMDFAEEPQMLYASLYRTGAPQTGRIGPLRNTPYLLTTLRWIEAPYPVDRLATMVEKGMGPLHPHGSLDAALRVLAESGHDRARALIELHLSLAQGSHNPTDQEWAQALREHLKLWESSCL